MDRVRISDWQAVMRTSVGPASVIRDAAGSFPGHHDLAAIEAAYRDQVARLLPAGIPLEGLTFWVDLDDFGVDVDWSTRVRGDIENISLAPYFAAHWALLAA